MESASPEGFGVCRLDGRAVFVQNALAGERWEILILKVTNTAVWAKGLKLLEASPHRIPQDCPNPCGGCTLRCSDYEEELRIKREHVENCLRRIGGLAPHNADASDDRHPSGDTASSGAGASHIVSCIHPSSLTERYRNKAIFAVAEVDGKACFGFYRPRSHDLIPVSDCLLQSAACVRDARAVVEFMNEKGIPAYHEQSGKGNVRHIFRRESASEAVLSIVAARGFGAHTAALVAWLRDRCPDLTGIVLNINKTDGNTVLGGDYYTLWGSPTVHQRFCDVDFEVSTPAFLQVNPLQAEAVYRKVAEYVCPSKRVLDLYCGAGTVSLCLAKAGCEVTGVEIVPEAIENAKRNAERNGLQAKFICCDSADLCTEERFDAVVVDPPRKGLAESVVNDLLRLSPEKLVYISCNPATLARDLKLLTEQGYVLEKTEVFDMFPRTAHVETVVLLTRNT